MLYHQHPLKLVAPVTDHYFLYKLKNFKEYFFIFSGGMAKNLLPYSVTPPRPAGPSEAQRKIEELTRQLEEEIEQSEEQGEYFGMFTSYFDLLYNKKYLVFRYLSYLW